MIDRTPTSSLSFISSDGYTIFTNTALLVQHPHRAAGDASVEIDFLAAIGFSVVLADDLLLAGINRTLGIARGSCASDCDPSSGIPLSL